MDAKRKQIADLRRGKLVSPTVQYLSEEGEVAY
jgi:hypothetical protein